MAQYSKILPPHLLLIVTDGKESLGPGARLAIGQILSLMAGTPLLVTVFDNEEYPSWDARCTLSQVMKLGRATCCRISAYDRKRRPFLAAHQVERRHTPREGDLLWGRHFPA